MAQEPRPGHTRIPDASAQVGCEPDAALHFLSSILEALPNPVFVKDEQHRWVLLNDSYCRFMGYQRDQLLGKSDHDFFPEAEAAVFWAKDDAVFATGELNENEEEFTDASGRVHVILTRKTIHRDLEGRRFLLGVITDITQRKQMERELVRSRDELERRIRERTIELERANARLAAQDRRKNEFLGVLSHELRNPLEPISNAAFILEHARSGEQAATARGVIRRQLAHLTRLVDDLLDITRISRGKVQLHRDHIDLGDAIARTVEDHRPVFSRRDIALELELADEPLIGELDPTRVAQIVGNLLHNSAKFTRSGGTVRVTLARSSPGWAEIRVSDTGIGIAPEMIDRIFEPFTQADESLHRSAGGLGLGLALVKGLAELQGGKVEVRSGGPDAGAEFSVVLPLAPDAAAPHEQPSAALRHSPRRVLVVEDNADAAETLRMLLEMQQHEVVVARDGREGVAKARAFRPDVVLCDLGLPELDGYQVAQALRADPMTARVTLVAISGYALPEDVRRAAEAGFDRHLAKPVPPDQLEAVLDGGQ